jgi:hypothetical protein
VAELCANSAIARLSSWHFPMTNSADRTIWTGDNLGISCGLNSASVYLIYLDSPFDSNRNYILMLQTLMDHSASVHGVKVVPPVRKSPLSPFERTATLYHGFASYRSCSTCSWVKQVTAAKTGIETHRAQGYRVRLTSCFSPSICKSVTTNAELPTCNGIPRASSTQMYSHPSSSNTIPVALI